MLLSFDLGRRFGVGRLSMDPVGVTKGSGPVEAAVFGLLGLLLAGFVLCVGKGRNWFYMLLFTTTISLTLYVIVDMEYPRYDLIRVDSADQSLIDLRALMD